tara:strand:- start:1855 stop:2361 length:507 start_codon:yes stop_codon:yes gene_type:complete
LKNFILYVLICFIFTACLGNDVNTYLGYGKSGLIKSYNSEKIRLRHIDVINALRFERALGQLSFSKELNASANTHALDISNQKRAWNFGSDYSSPQDRAEISGFTGIIVGENVSETFEGEFEVLQVWLKNNLSSKVILDPMATHIGLGWFQEENGTIWWVQLIGLKSK